MSKSFKMLGSMIRNGEYSQAQQWLEKMEKNELKGLDKDGVSLAHIAAERGDVTMLKMLKKTAGIPVTIRDSRGGQPILEAAAAGQLECVQWFITNGVDVNTSDDRGDTALHLAAGFGHIATMKWLIKSGAIVDSRTKIKVTPLLYATAKGRLDAIKLLLENGADLRATDDERGWNAVHTAAGCNQDAALRYLVNRDPSLLQSKTQQGTTPSHVAMDEHCPDTYLACMELSKLNRKRLKKNRQQNTFEETRDENSEEFRLAAERALKIELELCQEDNIQVNKGAKKSTIKRRSLTKGNKLKKKQAKNKATAQTAQVSWNHKPTNNNEDENSFEQGDEDHAKINDKGEQLDHESKAEPEHLLLSRTDHFRELENEAFEGEWVQVSRKRKSVANRDENASKNVEESSFAMQETPDTSNKSKPKLTVDLASIPDNENGSLILSPSKRNTSRWTLGNPRSTTNMNIDINDNGTSHSNNSHSSMRSSDQLVNQNSGCSKEQQSIPAENGESQERLGTKSNLRPHAAPWSPRRRRWTSPAANAGQVKARTIVDQEPEVVDNEFQRMLKKFVHMDVGARRTAKRKFAKATAEYEEKRLADAEQMEQSWRISVKSRLRRGVRLFNFADLHATLEEVNNAVEARELHDGSMLNSKDILADDQELSELVKQAQNLLEKEKEAPLESVSKAWRSGVLVLVPNGDDDIENEQDDAERKFDRQLRHSIESWRFNNQYQCVWLRFASEQCQLIPIAARLGFDFEHARPGYVIMKLMFPSTDEGILHSTTQRTAECVSPMVMSSEVVQVIVIKRMKGSEGECKVLLSCAESPDNVGNQEQSGNNDDEEQDIEDDTRWRLPSQTILSGEDPILVAESLVRETCGFAVSPHKLEESSGTFFCSVLVDEADEVDVFASGDHKDGLKWFALSMMHRVLDVNQIEQCTRLVGV